MRKMTLLVTALAALAGSGLYAQEVAGDWKGTLKAGGAEFRVVLHVSKVADGGLKATLDSLDVGANGMGLPVGPITLRDSKLSFTFAVANGTYEGKVNAAATTINGTWSQGPTAFPLVFHNAATEQKPAAPSDIDGVWLGAIDPGQGKFRIVFHIVNSDDGLTATGDCPELYLSAVPVASVIRNGSALKLDMKQLGGRFDGKISADLSTIEGTWTQPAGSLPLVLKRIKADDAPKSAEWQRPPYSHSEAFHEREITVGEDEWKLPGTLTIPIGKGPFPAVVLVHGSGPEDRDESLYGNKPFRDLAEGFASRGVAVLRYEKRTKVYGTQMAGLKDLTVQQETVEDAVRAAALLRAQPEVDPARVFVLGHSLGAYVAPRIAKQDSRLAGLILLAGNVRPLEELIGEQFAYFGMSGPQLEKAKAEALSALPPSYMQDLKNYNPAEEAKQLTIAMLILQGERDSQVTMKDFNLWKAALAGRKNVIFHNYTWLNHFFIAGEGMSLPAEYLKPRNVQPKVIEDIANWIVTPRE